MSIRTVAEGFGVIPDDAVYLDFSTSDGNSSVWPSNTTPVADAEGNVNFMQPMPLDSFTCVKWRLQVGKAVAAELGKPAGPSYMLRSWPEGYNMFDHNKGRQDNPRHDVYLFGPRKGRFRSINEFIPHAIWLMHNMTSTCLCKYCSRKAQKEITASMSGNGILTPSPMPSPNRVRTKKPRDIWKEPLREHHIYAAVQKRPPKPSNSIAKTSMLVERSSDLRAINSPPTTSLRRWLREGELVWCALQPPICRKGERDVDIKFWPALVEKTKTKIVTSPRARAERTTDNDNNGPDDISWTVHQSTLYTVQLLAMNQTCTVSDDLVLPYQAHVISADITKFFAELGDIDFAKKRPFDFGSNLGTQMPEFEGALPAYALAAQIASGICGFYSLTGEWHFKISRPQHTPPKPPVPLPASVPRPASVPTQVHMSLQSAIEAAGRLNQASTLTSSSSDRTYPHVSGVAPNMSQSDVNALARRVVGVPPTADLTQHRFQGLWWGAERIWVNDFVRLKTAREALAPNGAPHIYPPSGPGAKALEAWKATGFDGVERLGAGTRGVFLRVDSLFVVDVEEKDGKTKKECRASGMLFELAEEDWVPSQEELNKIQVLSAPKSKTSRLQGNGEQQVQSGESLQSGMPRTLPASPPPPSLSSSPAPTRQASSTPGLPNGPTASEHQAPILESTPVTRGELLMGPPEAPIGYVFRPILAPGYEAVISLGLISGRYYPGILMHPLIAKTIQVAMAVLPKHSDIFESHYWALEGLTAGHRSSVNPSRYKKNRLAMVTDADRNAMSHFEKCRLKWLRQKCDEDSAMDDDENEIDQLAMDVD